MYVGLEGAWVILLLDIHVYTFVYDGAMAIAPNAAPENPTSSEKKRKKRPRATEKRNKNGLHAYMERARPGTSPQSTPNLS